MGIIADSRTDGTGCTAGRDAMGTKARIHLCPKVLHPFVVVYYPTTRLYDFGQGMDGNKNVERKKKQNINTY